MAIRGLPGASSPTFRTWDERFVTLDSVLADLSIRLIDEGLAVAPERLKAVIQTARGAVRHAEQPDVDDLGELISFLLRSQLILIPPQLCRRVLQLYAEVLLDLDIAEVLE